MTYDQGYEIGKWIGGGILVVGFLWLATKVGEWRHGEEQAAAVRRAAIRRKKEAVKTAGNRREADD